MPATDLMSSPTIASRSIFTAGVPPMTAASNSRGAPVFSAIAASSAPCSAISALLAVTTGLPALRAADQLDEEVDLARGRERDGIVEPGQVGDIERPWPRARPRRDAGDAHPPPGRREVRPLGEEGQEPRPDRPEAGDPDPPSLLG